jgi:hypothetical protein
VAVFDIEIIMRHRPPPTESMFVKRSLAKFIRLSWWSALDLRE